VGPFQARMSFSETPGFSRKNGSSNPVGEAGGGFAAGAVVGDARRVGALFQPGQIVGADHSVRGECREQRGVVRPDLPLAGFMGNHGHIDPGEWFGEVPVGMRRAEAPDVAILGGMGHPVFVVLDGFAGGGSGDEDGVGFLAQFGDDAVEGFPIRVHAEFVAEAEHGEGWMVPVGAQDAFGFGEHPGIDVRVAAGQRRAGRGFVNPVVHPVCGFDLQVETEFVRDVEGDFRRAPCVKADVVETGGFVDAEHALPPCAVARRGVAFRVDGAVEVSPKEERGAVDQKAVAVAAQVAEADAQSAGVVRDVAAGEKGEFEGVECRVEFVPEPWCFGQGKDDGGGKRRGFVRTGARNGNLWRVGGDLDGAGGA